MSKVRAVKRPLSVQVKDVPDKFRKRQGLKKVLWVLLASTIIGGLIFPPLGFAVLICMLASVVVSFKQGRSWCDVCPRGSFFDTVMKPLSGGRSVPRFLRSTAFRAFMLAVLMGVMGTRLVMVWGDVYAMGMVFVLLLAITTAVGIALTPIYHSRTWCAFCPMGSMASWIGKGKQPLSVDAAKCSLCEACSRVCPMELCAGAFKEAGAVNHGDCIKCSRCAVQCPRRALAFEQVH